jgi:hypothetical protein
MDNLSFHKEMRILALVVLFLSRGLLAQNLIDYSSADMDWGKWDQMHGDDNAKLDFVWSVHF